MEIKRRMQFDKEFKQRTVWLVKEDSRTVKEIAEDLGIESRNIYRWGREYNSDPQDSFQGKGRLKPEDEELRRLKRQLADDRRARHTKKSNKHLPRLAGEAGQKQSNEISICNGESKLIQTTNYY